MKQEKTTTPHRPKRRNSRLQQNRQRIAAVPVLPPQLQPFAAEIAAGLENIAWARQMILDHPVLRRMSRGGSMQKVSRSPLG